MIRKLIRTKFPNVWRWLHAHKGVQELRGKWEETRDQLKETRSDLKTLREDLGRVRDEETPTTRASIEALDKRLQKVEDDLKPLYDHLEGHGERWPQLLARLERGAEAREALEAYTEKLEVRLKEMSETVKQQGYGIDGIRDQIAKDRPVFNRLKDSWLHPDYYYKNIVGVMEDRQRLLHKAIGLLDDNSRVLDIGPGNCFAMEGFLANGHRAEGVGLELESYIPKEVRERYKLIEADYNTWEVDEPYDAIFASHVLEHQPNNLAFVQKMYRDLREGGWLFVLVPPMKAEVVGGHLNLFNTGYLVYSLIVGGFDCSEAMVTKYGYNVVCFVRKKSFEMPKLRYDSGDIETLAPYFPFEATQNFNGLHVEANWKW